MGWRFVFYLFYMLLSPALYAQSPYIMITGITQDAGFPQAGCKKSCCKEVWIQPDERKWVASIAVVIPDSGKYYMIDATPDFKDQMHYVEDQTSCSLGGIFLTHAHIGHYTGLMHLGRESMNTRSIHVYVMPKMRVFIENNGPWSQLRDIGNIQLIEMKEGQDVVLADHLSVTPHCVPHRDEYSETVSFHIRGKKQKGWYIPDIDKWEKWEKNILEELDNDFLLIDGTFYRNGEIFGRDMSTIPHPFIIETMNLLSHLSHQVKKRVIFTHFNHTNPALWDETVQRKILNKGFLLAERGMTIGL